MAEGDKWTDALPEAIRDNPVFAKYDGDLVSAPLGALNALVEAQKFIGGEKVPVPQNADDKAAFEVIYKAMGRPDEAKLYELNKPDGLPEDFEIADADIETFKALAHELGLSPGQAQALYAKTLSGQNDQLAKMDTAIGEANTKAEVELRKEWGKAYDHNFNLAQKVFNMFGSDEAVDVLDGSVGSNPHILKMFAEIGKVIGEDTLIGGKRTTVPGIETPEAAKQKIAEIRADTNHPYHKGDKDAVAYVNQLYELQTVGEPPPASTETGAPV